MLVNALQFYLFAVLTLQDFPQVCGNDTSQSQQAPHALKPSTTCKTCHLSTVIEAKPGNKPTNQVKGEATPDFATESNFNFPLKPKTAATVPNKAILNTVGNSFNKNNDMDIPLLKTDRLVPVGPNSIKENNNFTLITNKTIWNSNIFYIGNQQNTSNGSNINNKLNWEKNETISFKNQNVNKLDEIKNTTPGTGDKHVFRNHSSMMANDNKKTENLPVWVQMVIVVVIVLSVIALCKAICKCNIYRKFRKQESAIYAMELRLKTFENICNENSFD